MIKLNKAKYLNYKEITEFLRSAQKSYPDLFEISSIGTTPQKRKIWLVSLTNRHTGAAEDKPALWVDANTHASEITGAQSCLYFICETLLNSKKNSDIKYLLDHMCFYILPQVSPDGAEFFLKNNYEIRSSPVPWPQNNREDHLLPQDINGDGEVLIMRKEDPAGAFKISKKNKNLLTQRSPFDLPEVNQKYFKIYKEGIFNDFDGFNEIQENIFGLDFNRQFPSHFRPEGIQKGAGSHPMSTPEIKAFVDAFVKRHRIFGHIALHTYGGLVLRPPGAGSEDNFDLADLAISKLIVDKAAEVSGYQALSTQKDFKYYSRESETGTADDWSFEQRGVFSFTVEIWDVWKKAQVEVTDHVSRYFKPAEEDVLKIFSWAESVLKIEDYYQPWKSFEHPQLGKVEIGGWKTGFLFRNPPPQFLETETKKVNEMILQMARLMPIVKIKKINLEKVDENTHHVELIVENLGFLPTNGSQQAIKVEAVQKPFVRLKLSKKLKLIAGDKNFNIEHLQGRNKFIPIHTPISASKGKNTNEVRLQWVAQGEGAINIEIDFQRGGIIKTEIKIQEV